MQAPPLSRLVDDAEDPREAADGRSQDEDDAEREQEAPDDFRVVTKVLPHQNSILIRRRLRRRPQEARALPVLPSANDRSNRPNHDKPSQVTSFRTNGRLR